MRILLTFIALLAGCALALSGCALEVRPGYYHRHHRHGHGHHHYWNDAGEAYREARAIDSLAILPTRLPPHFEGTHDIRRENEWRKNWPRLAAETIVEQMNRASGTHVACVVSDVRPSTGYYLELDVTSYDTGDPETRGFWDWSTINATGRIYNASTGQLVVELKFEESARRYGETPPFEWQMGEIALNLVDWFRYQHATP